MLNGELTDEEFSEIQKEMMRFLNDCPPPPWYRKLFPFLPAISRDKELRVSRILFWDCSHCACSITKKHFFDILRPNHRKWWQPTICGFQLWI